MKTTPLLAALAALLLPLAAAADDAVAAQDSSAGDAPSATAVPDKERIHRAIKAFSGCFVGFPSNIMETVVLTRENGTSDVGRDRADGQIYAGVAVQVNMTRYDKWSRFLCGFLGQVCADKDETRLAFVPVPGRDGVLEARLEERFCKELASRDARAVYVATPQRGGETDWPVSVFHLDRQTWMCLKKALEFWVNRGLIPTDGFVEADLKNKAGEVLYSTRLQMNHAPVAKYADAGPDAVRIGGTDCREPADASRCLPASGVLLADKTNGMHGYLFVAPVPALGVESTGEIRYASRTFRLGFGAISTNDYAAVTRCSTRVAYKGTATAADQSSPAAAEKKPAPTAAKTPAAPASAKAAPAPAAPKAAADGMPVVVEGVGANVEEARKNAIRNAVSKVVGEMVDAETLVENDELVKDQILTYSNGYVDSMEVLSTTTDEETGLVTLRIRADVRRTKLQARVSEVMQTEADADGDSLFAEMLSRQDSIEDAGKMLEKIFAGYREDLLLEAGAVMREDGRPAVELDPGSGSVEVPVRLSVKDDAWKAWEKNAYARLEKMCERRLPANARTDDRKLSELPSFVVGASRFYFKEDYRKVIESALQTVPEPQYVRVALVDRRGDTIAAEYLATEDFDGRPIKFGGASRSKYRDRPGYSFPAGVSDVSFSRAQAPATATVVFKWLSLDELKAVSKIVCLVGPLKELLSADAERMFAYRRNHPNLTITLDDGVSFELAPLSPRLIMGTTEVTQRLWRSVMGRLPTMATGQKGAKHPIANISWDDCQEFIKRLNDIPSIRERGLVFRLPRPEEWIAACRAGAKGNYCLLADGTEITKETLSEVAQIREVRSTFNLDLFPVGENEPNAFGLYDMIGNVREWISTPCPDAEHLQASCDVPQADWFEVDRLDRFVSSETEFGDSLLGFRLCASEQ